MEWDECDDRFELLGDEFIGAEEPEQFGSQIRAHLDRTRLAGLFLQSPVFMAVTRGPEHVFVNANPTFLELVGERDLLGRTAREAFPELEGQGFFEVLDRVYQGREPHVGSEEPVHLRRDGEMETLYGCYSYHPLHENGSVWGVLVHGVDVTERVRNRKTLETRLQAQLSVSALGRRVLEAGTVEEIYDAAVSAALRATGADGGEILLHRAESDSLVLRAGVGWDPYELDNRSVPVDEGNQPGRTFRQRRPVMVRANAGRGEGVQPVSPTGEAGSHLTVPLPGRQGHPFGVVGVHADDPRAFDEHSVAALESVAGLLGAAIVRRESERFNDTVAGNLPGILYRCRNDRDWTIEYLSQGTEELTGWTPEQLAGGDEPVYGDLIHPEDRERVWREVQRAVEAGRPFQVQYRIRTRDGEERWVWEQGRGVRREADAWLALEGCIFDITEWIDARGEAEEARWLLGAAFHGISDAVFVIDLPDRTIEWCNRAAEEMFGYGEGELQGRSTRVLHVDEERHAKFGEVSERALQEHGVYRGEFEMRRADGSIFPTGHSVSWVPWEGDGPERAVTIVRDITERKDREEALVRSRTLLRRYAAHLTDAREEERREMAREIHDDLGQTLTALKMKLDDLQADVEEEASREGLDEALEMVRSTLEKVRSLSTSLRPEVLDELGLERAVSQLVDRFRDQTGIEVAFGVSAEALELSPERRIHVYRVIQEALTNVARHAGADRVEVELAAEGDELYCSVRDDGTGFDPDSWDLMETGGLVGMRERARLLGGRLEVGPRREGGTAVRLVVPLEPPAETGGGEAAE